MRPEIFNILANYLIGSMTFEQARVALAGDFVKQGMDPYSADTQARGFIGNYVTVDASGNRIPSQTMFNALAPEQRTTLQQEMSAIGAPLADGGVGAEGSTATAQPQEVGAPLSLPELEAERREEIPRGNIFEQYLGRQFPGRQSRLEQTAFKLLPQLESQFDIQAPGGFGLDPKKGNTFLQFLEGGQRLKGEDLMNQIRSLADLVNLTPQALEQSPYITGQPGSQDALRNRALHEFYGGPEAPPERQFDPFLLGITQGVAPQARDLLTSSFGRLFRRQQYENPFQNFLDYARRNRLGGAFR